MKKIFKKTVGVILVILGFLALITPFSPGSWLLLIGLEFLGLRLLLEGKLRSYIRARPGGKLNGLLKRFIREPVDKNVEPPADGKKKHSKR